MYVAACFFHPGFQCPLKSPDGLLGVKQAAYSEPASAEGIFLLKISFSLHCRCRHAQWEVLLQRQQPEPSSYLFSLHGHPRGVNSEKSMAQCKFPLIENLLNSLSLWLNWLCKVAEYDMGHGSMIFKRPISNVALCKSMFLHMNLELTPHLMNQMHHPHHATTSTRYIGCSLQLNKLLFQQVVSIR